MLGAIIGDIIGSRFEFNPTNDYNFELFTRDCGFTDDTICTVAVADAILNDIDFRESIHEWCNRYPHPMGAYGGRFAKWVKSDDPQPYMSFGNGSAMRVSPVAWAYRDDYKVEEYAKATAECTHNHPEGIKGAQTIALTIHKARILRQRRNGDFSQEDMNELLAYARDFSHYNLNIIRADVENRFDETCQGTVPIALWIIGQSCCFEDAIRRAVSLGADADTLGAIVGSIAEAVWGIPFNLMDKALHYLPNEMKSVVLRFYSRFIRESELTGYGDEGAVRDFMLDEEHEQMRKQTADAESYNQLKAIMLWKLGLGNMGKYFNGEYAMPSKDKQAKETTWTTDPMPSSHVTKLEVDFRVSIEDMDTIMKGHIPDAQEDHWFMYCTSTRIRYYRSWNGMCAFEAHFYPEEDYYVINRLAINQNLEEFGVNGTDSAVALFQYLLTAEVEADAETAWDNYISVWEDTNKKHGVSPENARWFDATDDEYKECSETKLEQYLKEIGREKDKHEKLSGLYLLRCFVEDKLDGDIDNLANFDLRTLKGDENYGFCYGFAFSVEETSIARAIMSVAFADLWPGLNMDSIKHFTYRCSQVCSSQYLLGANVFDMYFKGMRKFNPMEKQHQRAVKLYHLFDTIGNIWIWPNLIVKDKDTYHFHGLTDIFLKSVYAAMTGHVVKPDLKDTLHKARKQMQNFYGELGFKQIARGLMLDDFLDSDGLPKEFLPRVWSNMKGLPREDYFKAFDTYCTFMESFVPKRSKMIVEKLKNLMYD